MSGHHLILGRIADYLTGETLDDTLDERYRQQLARRLVEHCGYAKSEVRSRVKFFIRAGEKQAWIPIDFAVEIDGQTVMIVRFGPGSLVTRHRPALAASRLLAKRQVPRVVVTNGEDADILDGVDGTVVGRGLTAIPHRNEMRKIVRSTTRRNISPKQADVESRLLYAFDVDDACPCDDTVCRI